MAATSRVTPWGALLQSLISKKEAVNKLFTRTQKNFDDEMLVK
jgi:hypothetical protein